MLFKMLKIYLYILLASSIYGIFSYLTILLVEVVEVK